VKRVLTAAILIPIVVLALFKAPLWLFTLLVFGVAVLAARDYFGIVKAQGFRPFQSLSYILLLSLFAFVTWGSLEVARQMPAWLRGVSMVEGTSGVLLVAAPLAANVPLVTLAAVLIVVSLRMGEWDEFVWLRRRPLGDGAVFLVTFALTVCLDLTKAVGIGLILAAGLFVKRVADTTEVQKLATERDGQHQAAIKNMPSGAVVYRVFGALLFGAADKLETVLRRAGGETRVIILHMAAVTAIDTTALDRLGDLHAKLKRHGRHLILCAPHTQPYAVMDRAGFLEEVGYDNIVADLDTAAVRARELIAAKKNPKPETKTA